MRSSVGGTAALIATAMLLVFLAIAEVAFADFRTVTRVVDGDTLVLDDGEKLRLIGVDTPETKDPRRPVQYFGREATNFTKQFVEGKKVRVEFDPANSATAHKDKYGRTLGYVFREDGKFLNAEIISRGFGHAYTRYPFKHASEFRALEKQARERNVGLWNDASTGAAPLRMPRLFQRKSCRQRPSTSARAAAGINTARAARRSISLSGCADAHKPTSLYTTDRQINTTPITNSIASNVRSKVSWLTRSCAFKPR
jgi:endonuclease YncB( thermonuclease family)